MELVLKELVVTARVKMWGSWEEHRDDIDPKKLYLVEYFGTWLLGRFSLLTYDPKHPRWIFYPNIGAVTPQIDNLTRIVEIVSGLEQEVAGDVVSHIISFLPDETEDEH